MCEIKSECTQCKSVEPAEELSVEIERHLLNSKVSRTQEEINALIEENGYVILSY